MCETNSKRATKNSKKVYVSILLEYTSLRRLGTASLSLSVPCRVVSILVYQEGDCGFLPPPKDM